MLAAAIRGKARAIVTFNLKDFPEAALATHGIEAIHPDDFLLRLLQSDLAGVCDIVRGQRAQLKNPPVGAEDFLNRLERQGLVQTAAILRTVSDQL